MNKVLLVILFFCFMISCQPRIEKLYELSFSNFSFSGKGVVQNAVEDGNWEIYNFMDMPLETGEFKNGLRYGDWLESKNTIRKVTNWIMNEDTVFHIKVSLPYKFDTLEIGDFYYAMVYKNHEFIDNIVFSINNPVNALINVNDIHIESEKFINQKGKQFRVERKKVSDNIHIAYLDEYTIIDSPSKEFYLLHFYTKLKNKKLIEITMHGNNLIETRKVFYKIIMNCFLEGERVFNPFIVNNG
jgi:hypothetical protein